AVTTSEPLATAITSIGLDHQAYLGTTLSEIAREKAGILKPNVRCFLGRLPAEAAREIAARAREVGAPLSYLGRDFAPPPGPLGLGGAHQRDNAAIAVALARAAAESCSSPRWPPTRIRAASSRRWDRWRTRWSPPARIARARSPPTRWRSRRRASSPGASPSPSPWPASKRRAVAPPAGWSSFAARCSWSARSGRTCSASPSTRGAPPIRSRPHGAPSYQPATWRPRGTALRRGATGWPYQAALSTMVGEVSMVK